MMRKHSLINDADLPPVLLKPLVFGDRSQIEALNDLAEKINQQMTKKAMVATGELRYFNVTVEYSGTEYIKVLAVDEADAKEKAEEEASLDDVKIDYVRAAEIKEKETANARCTANPMARVLGNIQPNVQSKFQDPTGDDCHPI